MYSRSIRSAVIAPEPYAMSQRSPQLPEVTLVHGGETKHGSDAEVLGDQLRDLDVVARDLGASQLRVAASSCRRHASLLDGKRLRRVVGLEEPDERPARRICASLSVDGSPLEPSPDRATRRRQQGEGECASERRWRLPFT